MRSHVTTGRSADKDSSSLQRKPSLHIGEHDDVYEREADRVANAVTKNNVHPPNLSLSKISITPPLQRDGDGKGKSEEDKYTEAAKKLGEAFLETGPGKEIKQKAEKLGDAFISTLPGKIITGSAITGAVAALAATHKELPIGIPEIPLDKIQPGLKMKITYEGPVDKPTKVMATFTIPLGPQRKSSKPKMSKAEQFRAETARMAREQRQFRESLKSPQQRAEEQDMVNAWVASQMLAPGSVWSPGLIGPRVPAPLAPYASDFRITGEKPRTEEPKKKKKKSPVQRKASNSSRSGGTPAIVNEVLETSGRPMEPATRAFMESRFGHDFSHVRIHTDSPAARSAASINALAYTSGNRIVFGHGQYSPETRDGRFLLAHELTHVLQQLGAGSARRHDPVIRRKAGTPAPSLTPAEALAETLRGDDDDVRGLTASPHWGAVMLTPPEAALLLIQLLDGATLNDDERAGLEVLKKALVQNLLDDSLSMLAKKNYFRQLLDDYHGAEYASLLALLSRNISKRDVKAIFLDAFIAMWWVNETEEEAIVVLLERTSGSDQHQLLSVKDRQQELRDAIDTNVLTIRYEKIAGKVNELHQADLAKQLEKLFVVISKDKAAAKNRTPEETRRLLEAAVKDLSNELAEYRTQLQKALKAAEPDADDIAEINTNFEARLKFLVERKQKEFKVELKYGIELNRLMHDIENPGLSWNLGALDKIDKVLAQIPAEMLSANPSFKAIERGVRSSNVAGQAPFSGEKVDLFGALSLSTTAHELGHIISYDNGQKLQNEFDELFKWEQLSTKDMKRLVPDQKARESLIRKMDTDHEKEREKKGNRHAHGSHYYRMNRYGDKGTYLRHPKSLCFVSDYAATNRYDDFAESFEAYVIQPGQLHKACPDKYRFMRKQVFTGYLYSKRAESVLALFDKESKERLEKLKLKGKLPKQIKTLFLRKLRDSLKESLDMTGEELEKKSLEAKPADNMKRVPLTGKEAQTAARSYRDRLDGLFVLLRELAKPWNDIWSRMIELTKVDPPERRKNANAVVLQLRAEFLKDIVALVTPPANLVLTGKDPGVTTLKEQLAALTKQCNEAVKVAPDYLIETSRLISAGIEIETDFIFATSDKDKVGPTAWSHLEKIPKSDSRRKAFKNQLIKRRERLAKDYAELRTKIIAEIKAGIPRENSKIVMIDELNRNYRQAMADDIVKEILRIISSLDSAARDKKMRELGLERAELQRKINALRDTRSAEKDELKRAELLDKANALKSVRNALDRVIQAISRDIVLSETRAYIESATHVPSAAEKTDIRSALKPDVKKTKSGKPLPFEPVLSGEKTNYEQKLRDYLPKVIKAYHDRMVKGRGKAEHSDPKKVHELKKFEDIGNISKDETDKLFGKYKIGPALKADTKGKRGNIHDLFTDMDAEIKAMDSGQRRRLARQLIFYFFQSNSFVRNLNRQHNASPKFSKHGRALNDEAKSLRKLAVEFTKTREQIKQLNEIDRGWPATAGSGDINIQVFKAATVDKDRAFLWDMFQTLIHEYLHTLVHKKYEKFAEGFGDSSNEYNTLIEGVDSLLTEIVWSNVEPRVNDKTLRERIEGPVYSKLAPIKIQPASRRRYSSYSEAIKVVNIVGIRNLYVAYFLGHMDRIGG
jgi:hypothetical protein